MTTTLKRRRQKARMRRELRAAFRTSKRELGDHRRWWWVATMPRTYFDPVFGCDTTVYFDPKWGRMYQPEDLTKHLREQQTDAT